MLGRGLALALLLLARPLLAVEPPDPTQAATTAVAQAAGRVLVDACVRCHGPTKAKGHLRLDSAAAIALGGERGAVLIPGDPAHSLLMKAVRGEDPDLLMPPDHPLPAPAIDALAMWIAAGAPWAGADGHLTPWPIASTSTAAMRAAPPPRAPLWGRVHPLVVHLPIACLMLALLAEFLAATRGPTWDPSVRLLMACAVAGAVAAVASGTWFAPEGTLFHHHDPLLTQHEFLGWMTLVISTAAWLLLLRADRPRRRLLFRLALLVAAVAIGITGHLGGTMVYGDHWLW